MDEFIRQGIDFILKRFDLIMYENEQKSVLLASGKQVLK
jgi:hypothetical protein